MLVRVERLPGPAVDVETRCCCSSWCGGPSASGARCCAAASPGVVSSAAFAAAGVAPESRPEQLGIDEWGALTDAVGAERA